MSEVFLLFMMTEGGTLVSSFSGVLEGTFSTLAESAEWNENSSDSLRTLSRSLNKFGLWEVGSCCLADLEQSYSLIVSFMGETLGMGWLRSENVTCVEDSKSCGLIMSTRLLDEPCWPELEYLV